jgi:hypothetical protein
MSSPTFESLAKFAFRFLVREYGFSVGAASCQPPETSMAYTNVEKGVGVQLLFCPNDLDLFLYRLKDGEFWRINDDRLYCCHVLDITPRSRWVPLLKVRDHHTKREIARLFRTYVIDCAEMLKREATDILSGDFSRWDRFEARVLKKQRQRYELAPRGIKALAPLAVVKKLKARK